MIRSRSGITYASVDDVKSALDVAETARADDQIRRTLQSATDSVEALLGRRFVPETRTQSFKWPQPLGVTSMPHTIWLDRHEVVSVASVTSGGQTITDLFLEPQDGPPYTRIELDADSGAAFVRASAGQRSITVAGDYGYSDDSTQITTLDGALTDIAATVDLAAGASDIGVGDMIIVGTERMAVTAKNFVAWDDPVTLSAAVAAASAPFVDVSAGGGALHSPGDVILVDAERMLVVDVNADRLAVKRAWDGSTLAAHALAAPVLCMRRLTCTRGIMGSTAAAHDDGAAVYKHIIPPMVSALTIAEAMAMLLQERSGYGRTLGSGEAESEVRGIGLADLRRKTTAAYGRRTRSRAS